MVAKLLQSESEIRAALDDVKTIALVGASPKPERASHEVMQFLLNYGYKVIPVNPGFAGGKILGCDVVASLSDIKEPVDMVDIFRNSDAVSAILEETLRLSPRPKLFWMQLDVISHEAAARAIKEDINVVMNECPHIILG